jgi:hypothetical protein
MLFLIKEVRHNKHKTKKLSIAAELFDCCREDRIRTCDPLVPNQVRYRPALLPDPVFNVPKIYEWKFSAVRAGFEPAVQFDPYGSLANY